MPSQYVEVRSRSGGVFNCYLVTPRRTPAPAIVLLQEIFGVNETMRELADAYAADGFIVITPDLFWRQRPGVQLNAGNAADRDAAMLLLKGLDESLAIEDAEDAMEYVKGLPECNGKVATVGYCLGGKLAFLMAARTAVDASVGYYGIGLDKVLGEAASIRKPLLLHVAGQDRLCPPQAQEVILRGIEPYASTITAYVYPGANHAFARNGGADFNANAAQVAGQRTAELLARLKS